MERLNLVLVALAMMLILFTCVFRSQHAEARNDLTYCTNGKGQVIIVDNYTCPPGWWRKF
jgi:hypothetical protein